MNFISPLQRSLSADLTFTINPDGTLHAWHAKQSSDMPFGRASLTDIMRGLERHRGGCLIQDAFPFLDAERREFIMTGTTPQMWNEMIPEECG
jgi:hypothetical protein|tara:strand:+ start:86 stop:364 length:279 start_codon:yes stop_codon:yes gene_type:complete